MDSFALSVDTMRARRGIKWHKFPDDVLPAWVADMDFSVPEPVQRAIRRVVEQQDYGYPWRAPEDSLEVAFANRMRQRFGWDIGPERTLPVADLVQAVVAGIVAFSEPGDGVVLQTPIYPPFLAAIDGTKRCRVVNPLVDDGTRFVLDVEGLRRVVDDRTRILLVCSPHNPTGRAFEREELEALGRLAVERDLVIICDEIHCDLVYPGRRHIPMGTLGEEIAARVVTINSATKGFNIAGLRCGVMHFGSQALYERFRRSVADRILGQVSIIGLDATVTAWRDGQPWLDEVMVRLEKNRDRVAAWAAEQAPGIRHHAPEATYLAWLDCNGLGLPGPSAQEFFLNEARVGLNPGEDFGLGGEGRVRLNFATSADILEQILERMGAAIRRSATVTAG